MFCILLARKCEFNMSGSDMKRDILIRLLNEISTLFKEQIKYKVNNLSSNYKEVLLNIMALCIVADGEIEDSEIEMAYSILENDTFIKKEKVQLDELGNKIDEFLKLKEKSESLFKLKVLSVISELSHISNLLEKENILLILEAMLESVSHGNKEHTQLLISKVKESLSLG